MEPAAPHPDPGCQMTRIYAAARIAGLLLLPVALTIGPTWLAIAMGW